MTDSPAPVLHRAGVVALVGRPNVGKSSLLNQFVGRKVSIVTPKPQTTRWRVLGIRNEAAAQLVFVDTPGMHRDAPRAVNRLMNRAAAGALAGVDVVVFVVRAGRWTDDDDHALQTLGPTAEVLVAVNQIDRLRGRDVMIPFLQELEARGPFAALVPVSAVTGENLDHLLDEIRQRLPLCPALYPEDQVSDRDERWFVCEAIREQLMLRLEQEVPYSIAVTLDNFDQKDPAITRIAATIWVERSGQQPIVVGRGGNMLKEVGRAARLELEQRWQRKVFLELWVKVRERWTDDQGELRALGLDEA